MVMEMTWQEILTGVQSSDGNLHNETKQLVFRIKFLTKRIISITPIYGVNRNL